MSPACEACWSGRGKIGLGQTQTGERNRAGHRVPLQLSGLLRARRGSHRRAGNNAVTVNKVWVCGDVGSQIINPSGAEAQVQGGVIDGLSELMAQEITLENGRVVQTNFNQHRLLPIRSAPQVEVHFVKSEIRRPGLANRLCRLYSRCLQRDLRGQWATHQAFTACEGGLQFRVTALPLPVYH